MERTDGEILLEMNHVKKSFDGTGVLRIVIPDFTDREFLRWRWENYNGL